MKIKLRRKRVHFTEVGHQQASNLDFLPKYIELYNKINLIYGSRSRGAEVRVAA
jgi:hypothetical protein